MGFWPVRTHKIRQFGAQSDFGLPFFAPIAGRLPICAARPKLKRFAPVSLDNRRGSDAQGLLQNLLEASEQPAIPHAQDGGSLFDNAPGGQVSAIRKLIAEWARE